MSWRPFEPSLDALPRLTEEQFMPRVNGVVFRCNCGCNVFKKLTADLSVYVCNGCGEKWRGE